MSHSRMAFPSVGPHASGSACRTVPVASVTWILAVTDPSVFRLLLAEKADVAKTCPARLESHAASLAKEPFSLSSEKAMHRSVSATRSCLLLGSQVQLTTVCAEHGTVSRLSSAAGSASLLPMQPCAKVWCSVTVPPCCSWKMVGTGVVGAGVVAVGGAAVVNAASVW